MIYLALAGVLCPDLGSQLEEQHRHTESAKGHKDEYGNDKEQ